MEVQIFDSEKIQDVPILKTSMRNIIICGETRPFRFLARKLEFPKQKSAIDLGCSTGETTLLLDKRNVFNKVIGIDIGVEPVSKGKIEYNLDLRVFDVLQDKDSLKKLIVDELNNDVIVFIDIGGDRIQDTVLLLINHIIEQYSPDLIVIKSRKLFRTLKKSCLETDSDCSIDFRKWMDLIEYTKRKEIEERKMFHPKRYPLQLVPGSEKMICRYHNYATCKKGQDCEQDHEHCHFCLNFGHIASGCEKFLNESLITKKKIKKSIDQGEE